MFQDGDIDVPTQSGEDSEIELESNDPVNVVRNCSTSPRSTPYAHYRICMKIIFKIEKSNSNDSRIFLNFLKFL